METVDVDDLERYWSHATDRRRVGEALDTTHVAVSYYEVQPGESVAGVVHAHLDQEEVFVPLEGTLTFRTDGGDVPVETGEAIRFAPGDYQNCLNVGDTVARVLAIGAPKGARRPSNAFTVRSVTRRPTSSTKSPRRSRPRCSAVGLAGPN
ncbi:cupin domain-containing protein [Haloarculaceae archaeon H-GB11]|nr:cupin domain-containing protein [Haloarculaceae archaeon H-GB11]